MWLYPTKEQTAAVYSARRGGRIFEVLVQRLKGCEVQRRSRLFPCLPLLVA